MRAPASGAWRSVVNSDSVPAAGGTEDTGWRLRRRGKFDRSLLFDVFAAFRRIVEMVGCFNWLSCAIPVDESPRD